MKKAKAIGKGKITDKANTDGIPVYCAHTGIVDIQTVRPNPRNPNRHPDSQLALLGKIIKGQGWRSPITISALSGLVVKGHARLAAAGLLGLTCVPVDVQHYASPEAEMADLLADNRIAELAELDAGALKDLLQELDTGAFDMDMTAFDHDALERLMNQYQPDLTGAPVTQGQMDAAGTGSGMGERGDVKMKLLCPHCGEEFMMDRKDIG